MINVSVVICTYNRAQSLLNTLKSLERQNVHNGLTYEVIVVDNNSKDQTKNAVHEFTTENKLSTRYLFEKRQGISYARNSGIRNAKGEIIACLDDDVIVDTNWLEAIWQCFQETKADAVGGRIARKWYSEKPEWYSESPNPKTILPIRVRPMFAMYFHSGISPLRAPPGVIIREPNTASALLSAIGIIISGIKTGSYWKSG